MSLQVKILLPDNLNSSFLRADFINSGATYFTGVSDANPAHNSNNTTLTLGFQLTDSVTRQPVTLARVVTLILSNDPQFDSTATFTLTNLPYTSAVNIATDLPSAYQVTLDPLYFFGVSSHPLIQSQGVVTGASYNNGTFIIQNWPLSATGGLSTVYFKAVVESSGGVQASYPDGYGLYDQIFWEGELPSSPGTPIPVSTKAGWTGSKTLWRFRASEESSTGLYGTGVARYIASVLEVRGGNLFSTNTSPSSATRTLAPNIAAGALGGRQGYSYSPTSFAYSVNTFDVSVPTVVSDTTGAAIYSTSKISLSDSIPDFCAQSFVSMPALSSQATAHYQIKVVNIAQPSGGSTDEVTLSLDVPPSGPAIATLTRSGTTAFQVTNLPEYASAALLSGGTLELYVNTQNPPLASNNMVVEAYFTSAGGRESFLLADTIVPCFPKAALALSAAVVGWVTAGTGSFLVGEICIAAGRFLIGFDAGDCQTDSQSSSTFPTTTVTAWPATALNGLTLQAYTEGGATATPVNNAYLSLSALVPTSGRAIAEVEASLPTFSDNVEIDFTALHTSGDLYVSLSPVPVNAPPSALIAPRPMGTRCDGRFNLTDSPMGASTLMIGLDATNGSVFVCQRNSDNTLSRKNLFPYVPFGIETWTINVRGEVSLANGDRTSVVIKRGGYAVGTLHIDRPLPTHARGLGWYVCLGTRSDAPFAFPSTETHSSLAPAPGAASVYSLIVKPLAPITHLSDSDLPTVRHLSKSTEAAAAAPPLLGQRMLSGAMDEANYNFKNPAVAPQVFAQRLTVQSLGDFLSTATPQLFEVRIRSAKQGISPALPQIRFYADINSGIDSTHPLTDWIYAGPPYQSPQLDTGGIVPYNKSVQFDLSQMSLGTQSSLPLSISAGVPFWVLISLPSYCEMASANAGLFTNSATEIFTFANGTDLPSTQRATPVPPASVGLPIAGSGWLVTTSLWHKLFTTYAQRYDNVYDGGIQQARCRAESQARISGSASALSLPILVDIVPPGSPAGGMRPIAQPHNQPSVRSITLTIQASDLSSGVAAFRVGRETDYGMVLFGNWQSWSSFYAASENAAEYTVYLYDTWPNTTTGIPDTYLFPTSQNPSVQNQGNDGPRRVWVQVMDGAGNISETYPIQTIAQSILLVDTVPPTGQAAFVSPNDGTPLTYLTANSGVLSLSSEDRVSGVKDFRTRTLGSGTAGAWSGWSPNADYSPVTVAPGDGIVRFEAQFRDYGNNALQEAPLWDVLSAAADQGLIFIAMARWTPPGAVQSNLYMSAIRLQVMPNLTLVDSKDVNHTNGTAFYAISYNSGSYGRVVTIRTTDRLTITVNNVPTNAYVVDAARGLIIFTAAPDAGSVLRVSVHRDSAILYQWDGQAVLRVADLGLKSERAILSLCATPNYLYLGGGSGNLYAYDGQSVLGPFYTATDAGTPLPISVLKLHQFAHETEQSLYIGTAIRQRLFRAPVSQASSGGAWSAIPAIGGNGSLTSSASAYNTLFLGSDQGAVLRYQRTAQIGQVDMEIYASSAITDSRLGKSDPSNLPVSSLCVSGNQVLAGIGNRPEIWAFSEALRDNPARDGDWVSQPFDVFFVSDPSPWQFYTANGVTNSRFLGSPLAWDSISDPNSSSGMRACMTLQGAGGTPTLLSTDTGSDWEQAISNQFSWTLEMDMQLLSGVGRQGFQVSDGRFVLDVSLTASTLRLTSGASVLEVPFQTDSFTAFQTSGLQYPERGVKKIWNFDDITTLQSEDRGPYTFGDTASGIGSLEGWQAIRFVTPSGATNVGVVKTETESDTASFSLTSHFLEITPTATGDPAIMVSGVNVAVDTQTKILVRMRVNPATNQPNYNLNDATLRVGVSDTSTVDADWVRWAELPLRNTAEYYTYTLRPSWAGTIGSIALEFAGLPLGQTRPLTIDIDYVAIVSDSAHSGVSDNLTPIRIGVHNQDVSAWVGRTEIPLIQQSNFLSLPTNTSQIRFGKVSVEQNLAQESSSLWAWGGVRFLSGRVVPPTSPEVQDFALAWRFPSTGGVRQIVNYLGTAWALTDGSTIERLSDSPDDHAMKAFSYYPDQQVWRQEEPPIPRSVGGIGTIRATAATTFRGTLVVGGQSGNLRFQPN